MELIIARVKDFEPPTSRDLDCQVHRDYDIRLNYNATNVLSILSTSRNQVFGAKIFFFSVNLFLPPKRGQSMVPEPLSPM
jgi:hypothetical protein